MTDLQRLLALLVSPSVVFDDTTDSAEDFIGVLIMSSEVRGVVADEADMVTDCELV